MKQYASYETIQSITWNPEGHRWVSVVQSSYQSHRKTSHKLMMFTIGLVLMGFIYQPSSHHEIHAAQLVQINVAPLANKS